MTPAQADNLASVGPRSDVAQVDAAVVRAGADSADGSLQVKGDAIDVDGMKVVLVGAGAPKAVRAKRVHWSEGSTRRVAQDTAEGAQVLAVYQKQAGQHVSNYEFPGAELQFTGDGRVSIVRDGEMQGFIEKPWAKDSSGKPMRTFFRVKGSRLTQVVQPSADAKYPIVADPSVVRKWYGAQVRFNRSETRKIGYGATACAVVATTIPDPTASKIVSVACGALSLAAQIALESNKCLAANVFYTGNVVPWYWNC